MSNQCECDLYVSGNKKQVATLLSLIGASETVPRFDFNEIVPYPDEFARLDDEFEALGVGDFLKKYGKRAKDGFNSGGYEWRLANWGTKWSASDVRRRDGDMTCVSFSTPWNPPKPLIVAMHKMFPETCLFVEYFERGMAFCGGFRCVSKDEADDYDFENWAPGQVYSEWRGEYLGHRGG